MIEIFIPGTGGYMPLLSRHLATCAIREKGRIILVDAGEGTQIALRKCGLSMKQIGTILLTHCHADHTAGLPGLLLTMGNEGRRDPVRLIGPVGTSRVAEAARMLAQDIPFPLECTEWPNGRGEEAIGSFVVTHFPVDHGIPCVGYGFDLFRPGAFQPERARQNNVPLAVWSALQKKKAVEYQGVTYHQEDVLGPARKGLRFVYSTDSRPVPAMASVGENADLMILEAMYGDDAKAASAVDKHHMLAREAAEIAHLTGAKQLVLTHFSPALADPAQAAEVARTVFPDTVAGQDSMKILLKYDAAPVITLPAGKDTPSGEEAEA